MIYKWVHEGRIPHVKIGHALRFQPKRIEAWVEEQAIEPSYAEPKRKFGVTGGDRG